MASNKDQKSHWVFRAHIMDRSGSLTSVASAFSNEGISISSIVAHGIREAGGAGGSVVLTFFCSEKEKDVMACRVKRLSKVIALEEKLYDSEALRKSIIIKTNRKLVPRDVAGEVNFLTSELVTTHGDEYTYFLAGSPNEIDPVLKKLDEGGTIKDIVSSVIGL
jgi:acetolactate synthase small subunit